MKPLTSDIALHNAANMRKHVAVFIGIERIGSGVIEEISDDAVKISGDSGSVEWYMRSNYSFWERSKVRP